MTVTNPLSPETLAFLKALKANNTREWFAANKADYEAHLKAPAAHFADQMAAALGALTGQAHSSKIFRIHRDVRFSKDKTPYNAHLHIAFTPTGQSGQPPMWFFGLSPGGLSLGCGVFQYDKAALTDFRAAMAGQAGADLIALTAKLRAEGVRLGDPALKRVPAGYDKDHPNAEALRRKGFAAWRDLPDPAFALQPDLAVRVTDLLRPLMPVFLLLSELAEARQSE